MKTLWMLFIMLSVSVMCYASPSAEKKEIGDNCLYSVYNQQSDFFARTKKYETVHDRWFRGVVCEADRYFHKDGWGYVARAKIVVDGKVWVKETHIGPDETVEINENWTQVQSW